MVDNFDIIRKILRFDNEDECYYVQLLRRAADDPKPDGKPDPAYHGNMHSRSVKDYFIHSMEHLDMVEEEIKELCKMFNVRAYIRLNRRSFKKWAGNNVSLDGDELVIVTLEDGSKGQAKHVATVGDYIIQGVKGEFYFCKPDIFADTYEKV